MRTTGSRTMGMAEWCMLAWLSVLWGGSFFFSKVALAQIHPFTIVLARVAMAAVVLHLVVLAAGQRMPASWKTWGLFAVMGALNNAIPFCLIVWGQTRVASGLASILNAATPLWAVLLAHLLTGDERMTRSKVAGVLFGLAGVGVMVGPEALRGLGGTVLAQLAIVGATVSYAFAGIFGKRFRTIPPIQTATGQVTCSAALLLPVALVVDRPWRLAPPSTATLGALLGLAVLSTALAYILYFRLLATAGATNLLLVTLLIPVSALLLGTLILKEHVDSRQFVGMGLIALGLIVSDGRVAALLRAAHARQRGRLPEI